MELGRIRLNRIQTAARLGTGREGREPVAFVWYRDSRIVRVAITLDETSKLLLYADYVLSRE